MKKLIYILLCTTLLSTFSCNDDFLDQKPLDSYSDLDVYNDLALSEAFLNLRYRNALEKFPWIFGFSASTDELYSNWNWFAEVNMVTGVLTADMGYWLHNWRDKYKEIRDLNDFLTKIDKVPGDEARRSRLKGEAIFLRAYNYFDLIRRYGGVPLIKENLDPYSSEVVERSTYDQCAQFVVSEMDLAATLLPYTYPSDNLGRITKGAALALKARMLLYMASAHNNPSNDMSRWTAAAEAAKAVIDLKDETGATVYQLFTPDDYKTIFTTDYNSEIILCRTHSKDYNEDNNVDLINSPSGYFGWSTYEPTQDLVDDFEMANGKMINDAGSGYDPKNPYAGREKRFYANIIYDGSIYRGREVENWVKKDANGDIVSGGWDSQKPYKSGVEYWNYSKTGYNMRKYTQENRSDINTNSPVKPALFRLTEMYLNYAEAQNMLGKDDEALTYLNAIRTRNGVNQPEISGIGGIELRDKIRHERKIELLWENHRYFDVRRWDDLLTLGNKDAHAVEITMNADNSKTYSYFTLQERAAFAKDYLFPIEKDELLRVNIKQNPGY
jgi:starch-binding outer membrane protein, SusD/RagB family